MNYKYKKTKKNMLPKLKPINDKDKKYHYKLSETFKKRKRAINEYINTKSKKTGKSKRDIAKSKKARLNVLRIYRRNKNKNQCKIITHDMKYLDKVYKLNKTQNICS